MHIHDVARLYNFTAMHTMTVLAEFFLCIFVLRILGTRAVPVYQYYCTGAHDIYMYASVL